MVSLLLSFILFLTIHSFDVFVGSSGSDNPECGLAVSTPCATLNYAFSSTVASSDRAIRVGSGSFRHLNAYIGSTSGDGSCPSSYPCTGGPYKLSVYGEGTGSITLTSGSQTGVYVYRDGEFKIENVTFSPPSSGIPTFTLYGTGIVFVEKVIFGGSDNRGGYTFLVYGGVLTIYNSSFLNGRSESYPFISSVGNSKTNLTSFIVRNVSYGGLGSPGLYLVSSSTLDSNQHQFTMAHSVISNFVRTNTAVSTMYGGVLLVSASVTPIIFLNTSFDNIQANTSNGGCIAVRGSTLFELSISGCSFLNVSGVRGAALWIDSSSSTNSALVESSKFQWCVASDRGGAIFSAKISLSVIACLFRNSHVETSNVGKDIHFEDASLVASIDDINFEGSCSFTDLQSFMVNTTDFSSELPHCSTTVYVATSQDDIPGEDSEACGLTFFTPCLTLKMALDLYFTDSAKVIVHNGVLTANPVVVNRAETVLSITSFFALKRNSTLRFNPSVSTSVPFFTVSNGYLVLKDINLLYNGELKGYFIKVSGVGTVAALENCLVATTFETDYVAASYSFASISGGGQLTVENSTTFKNVVLTAPATLFLVEGNGILSVNTIVVDSLVYEHPAGNITGIILSSPLATAVDFRLTINNMQVLNISILRTTPALSIATVNGTIIYIRSTSVGLNISDFSFIDADSTELFFNTAPSHYSSIYGGAIYVGNAPSVIITNANFSNGGLATSGGAVAVGSCLSVSVSNARFYNFSSTSHGGAVFFDSNVGFNIQNCVFINCSSTGGYGGAIASASTLRGNSGRGLSTLTFSYCSCSQNKGNDFADVAVSNSNGHVGLYSPTGITSNSASIKFYIVSVTLDLDCLFTLEGCHSFVQYVNSRTGLDLSACGGQSLPCSSFHVAWDHIPRGVMNIEGPGSYVCEVQRVLKDIVIRGIASSVDDYPKLRARDSTNYVFQTLTVIVATFNKVCIIQNSPTAARYFLSQITAGSSVLFDDCVFTTETGSETGSTSSAFINVVNGNCSLVNCLFKSITTSGQSPVLFSGGSNTLTQRVEIRNTSFSNIRATGEYPAAFFCNETIGGVSYAYKLYIYNSLFEHISGANSSYGTVGSFLVTSASSGANLAFSGFYNNTVYDVNTTGGTLQSAFKIRVDRYGAQTLDLIGFQGNSFDSIRPLSANGACLHIIFPSGYNHPVIISNSKFSNAEGAKGGAIYFQPAEATQSIQLERVSFASNRASVNGNDVYINLATDVAQYTGNFIASCSSSTATATINNIYIQGVGNLDSSLGSCTAGELYISASSSGSGACSSAAPCNSITTTLTTFRTYTTVRVVSSFTESSSVTIQGRFVTVTSSVPSPSSSRSIFQYSNSATLFQISSNGSLTLEEINVQLSTSSGSFSEINTGGRITINDVTFNGSYSNILVSIISGSAYVYSSRFSGTSSNRLTLAQTLFSGNSGSVLEIANSNFTFITTTSDKPLLLVDASSETAGVSATISSSRFTDITVSTSVLYGGIITYNGSTASTLYLIGDTFENVVFGTGSSALGGIVYGEKASVLSVSQSTFKKVSGAKSGGALYFAGAVSSLNGSIFEECNTTDFGGALFYAPTTVTSAVPSVSGGSFTNCRSNTGGGAICFNISALTGTFVGVVFGVNTGALGSNIIDISTTAESVYSKSYFVECTQSGSTNTFHSRESGNDYSCLIDASCSLGAIYVRTSTGARDFWLCGMTENLPCNTLDYAQSVAVSGEEIKVLYGVSTVKESYVGNKTVIITGVPDGSNYPVVHATWVRTTAPYGIYTLSGTPDDLMISRIKFELEANSQHANHAFIFTQLTGAVTFVHSNLTDCVFNITGDKLFGGNHFVSSNNQLNGVYSFTRVVFDSLKLKNCFWFIPGNVIGANGTQTFDSCTFQDMTVSTQRSLLYDGYNQNSGVNITITGCSFMRLSGESAAVHEGFVISLRACGTGIISNNTFSDYDAGNSRGGAIFLSGTFGDLSIENNTFRNIITSDAGVAIYSAHSRAGLRVVNCTFDNLRGKGAVYISNTVILFLERCSFIGNNDGDVYNSQASTFAAYTDETIKECCSSTPSPKLSFSDGTNKDFLLDLPCDGKIFYVSSTGSVETGFDCESADRSCKTIKQVLDAPGGSYSIIMQSVQYSIPLVDAVTASNKIVHLESSTREISTHTISYLGTLTITNGGELAVNDLNFTYGSSVVFANVQDSAFILEYVYFTKPLFSFGGAPAISFVQISGKSKCELVGVTFYRFEVNNAAVISFSGSGLFNLQESLISEANFSGSGLFLQATASGGDTTGIQVIVADSTFEILQIANPDGGVIKVSDDTGSVIRVTDVDVEEITRHTAATGNINGGFIRVEKAALVEIISLTVNTVSGATDGGALYFSNVNNVQITNSSALNVKSTNNGGVVYFGAETLFVLDRVVFWDDTATHWGGAVFSVSNKAGERNFSHVVFINNIADQGSDIYDDSTNGASFYVESNFANVSSNSIGIQFSIKGEQKDCLFTKTCGFGPALENIRYVTNSGSDTNDCKPSTSPCLTLKYAFSRALSLAGLVSNFTIMISGSQSITDPVLVRGNKHGIVAGDTYSGGGVPPPNSLTAVTGSDAAQTSFISITAGSLQLVNLSITIAPPSPSDGDGSTHSFVYVNGEGERFALINSTIKGGGTALVIYEAGTSGTLTAVTASDLAQGRHSLVVVKENCSRLTIQFSNFTNVTGGDLNTGAVLNYVGGTTTRLLVIGSVFNQCSSQGSGGAISGYLHYSLGSTNSFFIRNSTFTSCSSSQGDGGAIYLHLLDEEVDFVFAFTDLTFSSNTVSPSHYGNDVFLRGFELRTIVSLSHFEGASFLQPQDNKAIWGYDEAWDHVRNLLAYVLTDTYRFELTAENTLEAINTNHSIFPDRIYEVVVKISPYELHKVNLSNTYLVFEAANRALIDVSLPDAGLPAVRAENGYIDTTKEVRIEFANLALPTVLSYPIIRATGANSVLALLSVKFSAPSVVTYLLISADQTTVEMDAVEVSFPSSLPFSAGLDCAWTTGSISLTNANTTIRHSIFSNIKDGTFIVSGGSLVLDSSVKFLNAEQVGSGYATPPIPSKIGTCSNGGSVDVTGTAFFDNLVIDSTLSLWISTPNKDCVVGPELTKLGVKSLLFAPVPSDLPVVIDLNSNPGTIALTGTNLYLCQQAGILELVMYELTATGDRVNEAPLGTSPSSTQTELICYADLTETENEKWVQLRYNGVAIGATHRVANITTGGGGGGGGGGKSSTVNPAAIVVPIVVVVVVAVIVIVVVVIYLQKKKNEDKKKLEAATTELLALKKRHTHDSEAFGDQKVTTTVYTDDDQSVSVTDDGSASYEKDVMTELEEELEEELE